MKSKMTCQDFKDNLYKFLDKELTERHNFDMKQHLDACPLCQLTYENEKNFDGLVRSHSVKEDAPFDLRESVLESIQSQSKVSFWEKLGWVNTFLKPVGVALLVVIISITVLSTRTESFPLFKESVTRHLDCLKGSYPMEIKTSDIEEVTRWFEGKLNFVVNVPELVGKNVELKGARLCHLKDKKVALLTYHVKGKRMTVFVIDSHNLKIPSSKVIKGEGSKLYVNKEKGYLSAFCLNKKTEGVGCVFVSDMSEEELLGLIG